MGPARRLEAKSLIGFIQCAHVTLSRSRASTGSFSDMRGFFAKALLTRKDTYMVPIYPRRRSYLS
jgi:hypothetical protein